MFGDTSSSADYEFLLRCAASYNWDLLVDRCEAISSDPSRPGDVLLAQRQLTCVDQWKNTPLHISCYNNAPTRAIRALLDAGNNLPTPINLAVILSSDNSSSLLVACATGASLDVIIALLQACQKVAGGCRIATTADSLGNTPLSELCVQYELRRKTPRYRNQSPCLQEANLSFDTEASPLLKSFASKVKAIIDAAWCGIRETSTSRSCRLSREETTHPVSLLHGCANIAGSCPPVLANLLCRSYPTHASVEDEQGNLPLHLALALTKADMHPKLRENRAAMIAGLIEKYPLAAKVAMPFDTRSPLCQGIISGCEWQLIRSPSTSGEAINEGPLQSIWSLNPEALTERDPMTGLFPFMLAASACKLTEGSSDDVVGMNNIYCMLRRCPHLLHMEQTA